MKWSRCLAVLVTGVLATAALPAATAAATTFAVTATTDGNDDGDDGVCTSAAAAGACTLRAAIEQANLTAGSDTVTLPPQTVTLSIAGTGEDAAATGDLDVTEALTIAGQATGGSVVDAAGIDRVLDVLTGASLDLSNLTVRGGAAGSEQGGAIRSLGTHLGLAGVTVTQNTGRGVVGQLGPPTGDLTITGGSITANTGASSVVEAVGPATLTDTTIGPNTVTGPSGFPAVLKFDPFLADDVALTITRTTFSANVISNAGEGTIDFNPTRLGPLKSHLAITDSAFLDNSAAGGNGVLLIDPCGQGSSPLDATITRTRFARNSSAFGPAIYWGPCGGGGAQETFAVVDSLFADNVKTGSSSLGGAIAYRGPDDSTQSITGSTFSGNRAGTLDGSHHGGALFLSGGALTVTNSTFSGNQTAAGTATSDGGGAIAVDDGTLTLTHVTLAGNSVSGSATGGAIRNDAASGAVTIRGSILAGNSAASGASNCAGLAFATGGSNLESAATCALNGAGDLKNADPLLAALADNGGPTPTRALGDGSPARDAAASATCPATDQRGTARPQGTACDIGAVEAGAPVVVVTPTPTPPPPAAVVQPPPPVAKPTLTQFVTLPSTKRCVSRRHFRIRLRQPAGIKVRDARVFVNGRRVAVRKGSRLTAPVDLRGLPKGRFTVKIIIRLVDKRVVKGTRKYRTCVPKRRSVKQ